MGRKPAVLLSAIAIVALAIPAVADAKKKGKGGQKITVMTRNVLMGPNLRPITEATSVGEAIDLAGVAWAELQATKFEERVVPLVREIKKAKPDLVGLQEVPTYYTQAPSDGGAPPISPIGTPATQPEQDFLALIEQELKKRGPQYKVVDIQEEFDLELPVDVDQSDATGSPFGADFDARIARDNVILARKGSKVKTGKTDSATFAAVYEPTVGGLEIPVSASWQSVAAKVRGKRSGKGKKPSGSKKRGKTRKFLFLHTHLDAYGDPTIREAQANELIASPADTKKQVILVGDINSGLQSRHATGGYQFQPGDPLAFQAFAAAGFKDNGAKKLNGPYPQTCCDDPRDHPLVFDHTVDHVLTKPGLKTLKAFATGNDPDQRTPSGLYPSDHGGKVSKLKLKKK